MTKRKADYPQTEAELTPESREPPEGFTQKETGTGVVAGAQPPAGPGSEGMGPALFEELLASVREAGAMLRGEREAARRTRLADVADTKLKKQK